MEKMRVAAPALLLKFPYTVLRPETLPATNSEYIMKLLRPPTVMAGSPPPTPSMLPPAARMHRRPALAATWTLPSRNALWVPVLTARSRT